MHRAIYFDRDVMVDLMPREVVSANETWYISPYSIPESLTLKGRPDALTLAFEYPGGETGEHAGALDGEERPFVFLKLGEHSGKVMELGLLDDETPDTSAGRFRAVARRLEARAARTAKASPRFSLQMVARVLDRWAEEIARRCEP